jgi:hypothetical protein
MSNELEELVDTKIEELKMVLTGLINTYLKSQSNSFLKTKDYQELVSDRFLSLDNELQNRDTWDKDEILEMSVLFLLMTVDEDIEEIDDSLEEPEEVIDVKAE